MLFVQNELHFITFCAKRVFIKDGYCPVCIAFRCAFELFCACHFVNKRHRNQKYRVVGKLNNSALKYLLHTVHCPYSILPVDVQVAATAAV